MRCRPTPHPRWEGAYARAATDAIAHAFAASFTQAMWFQVVVYVLVFVLLFRLPKVNPRQLAELDADAVVAG